MRTKARRFRDDEIVECWMPFAVASHTISQGTRLRGSHEAVRLAPRMFNARQVRRPPLRLEAQGCSVEGRVARGSR